MYMFTKKNPPPKPTPPKKKKKYIYRKEMTVRIKDRKENPCT